MEKRPRFTFEEHKRRMRQVLAQKVMPVSEDEPLVKRITQSIKDKIRESRW